MAKLDCLKDTVGLSVAGTDSGLALINLPGISLNNFSGSNDADNNQTNDQLWQTIKNRSVLKFLTAVTAKLNECYKINDATIVDCLVCEKVLLFYTPFWYLLGAETMIERIYSDNVNRWTSIDIDEARELLAYYTAQFENELQYAVAGISPADSDCIDACLECSGPARFVEGLP